MYKPIERKKPAYKESTLSAKSKSTKERVGKTQNRYHKHQHNHHTNAYSSFTMTCCKSSCLSRYIATALHSFVAVIINKAVAWMTLTCKVEKNIPKLTALQWTTSDSKNRIVCATATMGRHIGYTAYVTRENCIWLFGRAAQQVTAFQQSSTDIAQITRGPTHCSIRDTEGKVYSIGQNNKRERGVPISEDASSDTFDANPVRIESLSQHHVVDVQSGRSWNIFRTAQGHVFTNGDNSSYILGHSYELDWQWQPKMIEYFAKNNIRIADCAAEYCDAGVYLGLDANDHTKLYCVWLQIHSMLFGLAVR